MKEKDTFENQLLDKTSKSLYRTLLSSVSLLLLGIIFSFFYLLMGNPFQSFFKPKKAFDTNHSLTYSKEGQSIENGIDLETGLKVGKHYSLVKRNCTVCHSAKLITQNSATKEGWQEMIDWMQATQGLWDLGLDEDKIVKYLAKNYAPEKIGRRANLETLEWYELEEE